MLSHDVYEETKKLIARRLGYEDPDDMPPTVSVPKAGKAAYNLSGPRSYVAVKDGTLETVMVAGRLRVPTLKLVRKLAREAA